jgi:hypothetical protein
MTWLRRGIKTLFVLAVTCLLLRLWFGTSQFAYIDERTWTFFNDLLGQQRVSLATDIELVFVAALGVVLSVLVLIAGTRLWRYLRTH